MTVRSLVKSGLAALAITCFLLVGCGGRQRPPETGSCRAGREWVPPHEENGQMMDGYCRDAD